ncbi:MAG: flagellar brake domain-containing protein [Lachnospiraceae bacterium]|nr:flagellar brake domain-containing protein [Lachnospiraceae bacterium]
MLSKFIMPGCKVELQAVDRINEGNSETAKKVYKSKVLDILSEDRMEIIMPMEQTKLILLPVDGEYDAVFFGSHLYQCFLRIIDRYKSNNVYILVVEMISNLRKYQRREYYRFSCALEMCARPLVEEEVKAIEQKDASFLTPGLPLKRSVIVDISGGGLRFMSDQRYEPESLIYCTYNLLTGGRIKVCEIIGKILGVKELENKKGTFEHRVQYVNLDVDDREEIIKYIFEEERKNRHREKG